MTDDEYYPFLVKKNLRPAIWRWDDLKPRLDDVLRDPLRRADRRFIALVSDDTGEAGGVFPSIFLGIQTFAPGEHIVPHRHNSYALYHIIEGEGYSVLDGQRFDRARTLLLWLVFFMNLLLLYFLVNWLPSLLRQAGVPLDKAIVSTALLNLAVIGAQISINALAAASYPAEMRSAGVGLALGIGRAGSVVDPVVGGILLATGLSTAPLFAIAAIAAVIAGLAVLLIAKNAATQGIRT